MDKLFVKFKLEATSLEHWKQNMCPNCFEAFRYDIKAVYDLHFERIYELIVKRFLIKHCITMAEICRIFG